MEDKRIGELNGRWSIYFRIMLLIVGATLPMVISLQVWMVNKLHDMDLDLLRVDSKIVAFSAAGPRYTPSMATADQERLKAEILRQISTDYPPDWLKRDVELLRLRVVELETK